MEEKQPFEPQETPLEGKKDGKKLSNTMRTVISVAVAVVSFFGGMLTYSLTLDKEMRSLINLKTAIQNNYYKEISDQQFYDTVFDAINEQLLDAYSRYMTADEYATTQTEATGKRSGLGLVFSTRNAEGEKQMLISRVCGNSPAEAAGILEGDFLVGFGKTQDTITSSEDFDEFALFLDGCATGETFCLKVKRGNENIFLTIAKSVYVENYVFYRTNKTAYRFVGENAATMEEGGMPLACLDEQTAYIRLTQFNGNAADEFFKAMQRFQTDGKKHLVLDLRGNGGGYLDILQEIAGYFCKTAKTSMPLVTLADYGKGKTEKYNAKRNIYSQFFGVDSRIYVLADDSTASASEALIGCMVDYGATRYEDICLSYRNGQAKTYGKGIMQTTYPFGLGRVDAVKLTTATLRWPVSGNCIHGVGVTPQDGAKTVQENYAPDAEIQAAVALFTNE